MGPTSQYQVIKEGCHRAKRCVGLAQVLRHSLAKGIRLALPGLSRMRGWDESPLEYLVGLALLV